MRPGVVTAVTAQNTVGVQGALPIPTDFVVRQIDTLFEDVHIDSVKIGMLFVRICSSDCGASSLLETALYRP